MQTAPDQNETPEIIAIIDMSGSMSSIRSDAIGGFNTFLETQKEENPTALLTVILFNDQVETLIDSKLITEVKCLTRDIYIPSGMTAMYDAIGTGITNRTNNNVAVAILTDGEENSSREWTKEAVSNGIAELTDRGWAFIFLAANMNAWEVGQSLNMTTSINYAATGEGVKEAYRGMSKSVTDSIGG